MSFPAKDRATFIANFFDNAVPLQDYNGAGIISRSGKQIARFLPVEEFVAEAKARGWRLIKVNDQYFGYNPEKNPEFTIKQLC